MKMIKLLLLILFLITCLNLAHLASFIPKPAEPMSVSPNYAAPQNEEPHLKPAAATTTTTTLAPPFVSTRQNSSAHSEPSTTSSGWSSPTQATISPNAQTTTSTISLDPDLDPEIAQSTPAPSTITVKPDNLPPSDNSNKLVNSNKPSALAGGFDENKRSELNVLFYSIFIVYVSFVKLIYHNVEILKRNLTEPGILMIFGIIWELIARQLSQENFDPSPKFNSRIFFYLFLPSCVLEAGALLSNKWLFLNLLSILIHSIFGTLLYASALGFTIHFLSKQAAFNLGLGVSSQPLAAIFNSQIALNFSSGFDFNPEINQQNSLANSKHLNLNEPQAVQMEVETSFKSHELNLCKDCLQTGYQLASGSGLGQINVGAEVNNLTLADCLMFGTILSSIDSSCMLNVFRQLQMNDKLYYLVLGESLVNNAVVLIIFDLLLEFLNETKLTVVKVYFLIIQFFLTLFGGVFIGLILAIVALISVRLTKRFQVPNALISYQNQCQVMVETLLVLKLAYLTYTLAALAGTSSIISLATFGILQDQYIKHNLNLRSQLTFRQVVLATRTLGFSLVYPILGMLLVDVANTSQFFQHSWPNSIQELAPNQALAAQLLQQHQQQPQQRQPQLQASLKQVIIGSPNILDAAASVASNKLSQLASQANLNLNFKFLSLLTCLSVLYRFLSVILLTNLSNLFISKQLKIKFREQILLSYGGLKGPIAFALVQKLIEHEAYRTSKTMRNKHLFMYTILFITFMSTLIKGCFIRPLVAKVQFVLNKTINLNLTSNNSTVLFDEINCKLTEHLSDGLNSLLGHSKSPYDKFAEFNETIIKPWLSRDESNTNWLSAFYDNLILDETLNANCFYRSTEQVSSSYLLSNNFRKFSNQSASEPEYSSKSLAANRRIASKFARKRSASSGNKTLEVIDENLAVARYEESSPSSVQVPVSIARLLDFYKSSGQFKQSSKSSELRETNENDILKEFVMLNLKLEEAKSRRRQSILSSKSSKVAPLKIEKQPGPTDNRFGRSRKLNRMLSTTSSNELDLDSSYDIAIDGGISDRKANHLENLERITIGEGGNGRRRNVEADFKSTINKPSSTLDTLGPMSSRKSIQVKRRIQSKPGGHGRRKNRT